MQPEVISEQTQTIRSSEPISEPSEVKAIMEAMKEQSSQNVNMMEKEEDENRPYYWATRNDVEATMRCEFCLDKEWENDDAIILCDMCNASVHINCSMKWDDKMKPGVVPEGNWYCERCSQPAEERELINCYLCERKDGLIVHLKKGKAYW